MLDGGFAIYLRQRETVDEPLDIFTPRNVDA
jgi:hypothetical protein